MSRRSKPFSLYEEKERRRRQATAKYRREYGAINDIFAKLVVYVFFGVFIALWYIIKELLSFFLHRNRGDKTVSKTDFVPKENVKPSAIQWAGCFAIGLICLFPILSIWKPSFDISEISILFIVFFAFPFLVATLCVVDYNKTKYRSYHLKDAAADSDAFDFPAPESIDGTTPEEAIAEIDRMNAKILMDEFQDSLSIMQKTADPSTFFSRFDFALERLDDMIELKEKGFSFAGDLYGMREQAKDEDNLADTVNCLIDNSYKKQLQKLSTLKTERGKANSNQRWYASFEPFFDRMPMRSRTYLDLKLEELKEV